MDSGTMAQWGAVIIALTALVVAWINRRTDKIEGLETAQDVLERRVAAIETEVKHLPGVDLVHELQLALTQMRGDMNTLLARVEPIKAIAERMQDWALEGRVK